MSIRVRSIVTTMLLASAIGIASGANVPVDAAAQVVLPDGRTLTTGGQLEGRVSARAATTSDTGAVQPLSIAMLHPRRGHTATVLPNGRVLIWGGVDDADHVVARGEWFDPASGRFSEADEVHLLPRAEHTATVLSDGRLLLLGGHAGKLGPLAEAEVWDWRSNRSELLPVPLMPPREGHSASLLADGRVLIIGADANEAALYDPEQVQFLPVPADVAIASAESAQDAEVHVAAATPSSGTQDVALDAVLALRFAPPLAPQSVDDKTVTLFGPHGATPIQVVAAEAGRLAFITPQQELFPASHYTLFVQGAHDAQGNLLPFYALEFDTQRITPALMDPRLEWRPRSSAGVPSAGGKPKASAVAPRPASASAPSMQDNGASAVSARGQGYRFSQDTGNDDEFWVPTEANLGGRWRTQRPLPIALRDAVNLGLSRHSQEAAWRSRRLRAGATEISGQVLRFNDLPLPGVEVRVGQRRVVTDASGRFIVSGVDAGHQELVVDGRSAGQGGDSFGQFVIGLDVEQGKENPVKPIYLPKIRTQDWIEIPSPLAEELVVKSPYMPGFEAHLPAGTILRDRDGKVVRRIALIPMPLDRTPIDYPVNTPLHMTFQPGGMRVEGLSPGKTQGIRFVYPNYSQEAPGTQAGFLNYDPAAKGWYTYGYGRVSEDGQSVVPDPDTQIYSATGFAIYFGAPPPPTSPPASCGADPAEDGDPVDLRTGLFKHRTQGPALSDIVPLSLRTTYRPSDALKRGFGKGTSHTYGVYLYNPGTNQHTDWSTFLLVLSDCSVLPFNQVSETRWLNEYVATHTSTPSSFYGAKLTFISYGNTSVLRLIKRDGTQMDFSFSGGDLLRVLDRHGRSLEITRSGGLISRITTSSGRYIDVLNDAQNRIKDLVDTSNRHWSYVYDTAGYLQQVTYPDSSTEQFTYDAQGRMTDVVDRRGNAMVHNVYDNADRVTDQALADGATYQFAYTTDTNGVVTQADVTQPNGSVRRVVFHASGYPSSDTDALGTALQRTVSYERDDIGFITALTDPLDRRTELTYDTDKHVTAVTDLAGTAQARTSTLTYTTKHDLATLTDPWQRTTTWTWDARRRLAQVEDPFGRAVQFRHDTRDLVTQVTDPLNRSTAFGYDLYDLNSVTDPLGRITQRYTDTLGRVNAVTDALGRRSEVRYDANGRPDKVTRAGASTQVTYDALGNLLTLTDPMNRTTAWTYDSRQRPLSRTDALGQTESWTYLPTELGATATDRSQRTTTAVFDTLGRLSDLLESDGRHVVPQYDLADRLLSLADSSGGPASFGYNAFDQLLSETGSAGNLSYAYDGQGRLQSRTLSGQGALTYGYDTHDRIASLTQGSDMVGFTYDNADRRTTATLSNGVTTTATYDDRDSLMSLSYTKGQTVLGDLTYGYDAAGQLTNRGGSWMSTPLPSATTNPGSADANHRLTAFNDQTLSYDLHGNLTGDGVNAYVYDARDQLVQIQQGSTTQATFQYDPFGRRIGKTIDGITTTYRYDGENPIEETSNGVTRAILSGLRPDERYARDDTNGKAWFLTDHLGSTVALTGSTGELTARYHYEAYGETTIEPITGASTNPYQYTGRENDGLGLYYYRARYYSSGLKRFTQEDPMGFVDGPNLYAYVGGSPLMYIDPYGLWALGDPLPQGMVDFGAGMGDVILIGQGQRLRDLLNVGGGINKCSSEYGVGEWVGVGASLATGFVGGVRAAGVRGAGREFSHWIPNRMGGPRSFWNGNYVSTFTHALSDPYRYRFMPRIWKAENPLPNVASQQWVRIPNVYKGGAGGGAYGAVGAELNGDCTCAQ